MHARFERGRVNVLVATLLLGTLYLAGCDTGVGASPEPGILEITLQAAPGDSTIDIGAQSYNINRVRAATFEVVFSETRAYRDSAYAQVLPRLVEFDEATVSTDILERASEDETPRVLLYRSYLPPATYDSLKMVLSASNFTISDERGTFSNSVQMRPEDRVLTFADPFRIEEEATTTLHLTMKPLASLERFKDVYFFEPQISIERVER